MTLADISNLRLQSQQILSSSFKKAQDLVGWMGAMQAQDYAMAKWAVGIRLENATDKSIEAALDKGEIIRTHVLRPTWHLVSAKDIHWMLELTAPHIRSSLKSRHKELELTESLFKKANSILEKALSRNKHLTREELYSRLEKANLLTDAQRGVHILFMAELNGLLCSGPKIGKEQSYALLDERVPLKKSISREEALAKLTNTYFSSHGPASLQDFAWWSGLPMSDVRKGLDMVKENFTNTTVGTQNYWYSKKLTLPKTKSKNVYILPAFDEFIISYRDRTPSLLLEHHSKTISSNGIFRPVIVVNGQVTGLWKRTIKKESVVIETDYFQPPDKAIRNLIEKAFEEFGKFLGKNTEIKNNLVLRKKQK